MHESRERGLPLAPGAPELLHSPGRHTEDSPSPTWSTWSLGTNVHCPKHTQQGPAMGILSWVTKPYTRTIPYHAINTQRAVVKCLTINQGTQRWVVGVKFVEVLRNWLCPREGQSIQSVEAPIQPTGAQGFSSGNCPESLHSLSCQPPKGRG